MNVPAGPRLAESTRVEAFSDGVFAIAITLLVLDLKVPEDATGFGHTLLAQWPSYLAYLAAFLNIASIWINHHDLFNRVARVDIRLICINLFLLFITSLFPWPTSVLAAGFRLGNHHDQVIAAVLFATIGFFVPLGWIALYRYTASHLELLTAAEDVGYARSRARQSVIPVFAYPAAAVVAIWQPVLAVVIFVLIPLIFIATLLLPAGVGRARRAD